MKFLIPAFLLAMTMNAQTLLTNTKDEATGARTIITKNSRGAELDAEDTVVKRGHVFFSAGYQEIKKGAAMAGLYFVDLNIIHNDIRVGCLKQGVSKVELNLIDGTVIECTQISDSDCDNVGLVGTFALMKKGGTEDEMKANFKKLEQTEVKTIRLYTTEREILYYVKPDLRQYLQNHFKIIEKNIG